MDPRFRHTFIVRFWQEGRARRDLAPEWRFSVRHVGSGKLAYFRDLLRGMQFMQQTCLECGDPTPEPSNGRQLGGSE